MQKKQNKTITEQVKEKKRAFALSEGKERMGMRTPPPHIVQPQGNNSPAANSIIHILEGKGITPFYFYVNYRTMATVRNATDIFGQREWRYCDNKKARAHLCRTDI